MLEDAHISLILTQQRLTADLPDQRAHMICLDRDSKLIANESNENPTSGAEADNLAYIIYTSGSTGTPKGVLLEHRGLCNLIQAQIKSFDVQPDSIVLQFASLNFDASVSEIFTALLTGATLCLEKEEALKPGPSLVQLLCNRSITTVTLPPAVLAALPVEELPALRTIITAGEACSASLVSSWGAGRRFINAYGPTEGTVCATISECIDDGQEPTIGRPIPNVQIYLLDEYLQPVPVGVPAELYIGGIGLARGYLNQPELTAEKFIPSPFDNKPATRLYKSGDLARYRPDGNIEFLGRLDHQIKIRGYRIEIGEIETVLRHHPDITEAVVLPQEALSGGKRLVCYIVLKQQSSLTINELRNFLKETLPEYMIPSKFVVMQSLPLNRTGKVDRNLLAELDGHYLELDTIYVAPRTEVERVIAMVWQEYLDVKQVGMNDNFFDLGGHSLLIVQVHSKLQEIFKKEFPMVELFKYPTIDSLARFLSQDHSEQPSFEQIHDRAKKHKKAVNRQRRLTEVSKPGGKL
jgi:amino acid adenylation domain-containing protein